MQHQMQLRFAKPAARQSNLFKAKHDCTASALLPAYGLLRYAIGLCAASKRHQRHH